MRATRSLAGIAIALLTVAACRDVVDPTVATSPLSPKALSFGVQLPEGTAYSTVLDELNNSLAAAGSNVSIASAEISVSYGVEGWDGATTIYAKDRAHTLSSQFVAIDPRRGGSAAISYFVDQSDGSARGWTPAGAVITLTNSVTEPEIDASTVFWQNQPRCGAPQVVKVSDDGGNHDIVDNLVLGGTLGSPVADIVHGGWLARVFFDRIAPPNGSAFILGVTFTFIFVDQGIPTDIDRDGRVDVAFREIYYNRRFPWGTDANPRNVDIQSVAIHEAGHAYGLGHFGKVFVDNNGVIKYAPKAIMNAVYIDTFRELTGSDNSSFCQIWASAN